MENSSGILYFSPFIVSIDSEINSSIFFLLIFYWNVKTNRWKISFNNISSLVISINNFKIFFLLAASVICERNKRNVCREIYQEKIWTKCQIRILSSNLWLLRYWKVHKNKTFLLFALSDSIFGKCQTFGH